MATFPTPINPSEKRRPKYGNRKTVVDGITFDSAKEARRWGELLMLQKAGEISCLCRQVRHELKINSALICVYLADFRYVDSKTWKPVVEDVKGVKTAVYKLKKRLMLACHGIEIREV